jgi:hypothetical protein
LLDNWFLLRYNTYIATNKGQQMKAGNTLEVRAAINAAFDELKCRKGRTWTDPVNWSRPDKPMRVVTYQTTYAGEIAERANRNLRAKGFNNQVRVTDTDAYLPGRVSIGGPYVRVNALRA